MANGTLKVENIQTSSGSGTITIGQSGETVAFGSGVTSKMNQPAFEAQVTSTQSLSDLVYTKVEFDDEIFDTDNCYDNSTNYRFTPTVAGKYFIYTNVCGDPISASQLEEIRGNIYKNGSSVRSNVINFSDNDVRLATVSTQAVVDMNGSTDYIEIYIRVNDTSGSPQVYGLNNETYFGAYRIGA